MDELEKKAREKMKEYLDRFGDSFMNCPPIDPKQIIEEIDECLKADKDAYEMGFYSNDPNILY